MDICLQSHSLLGRQAQVQIKVKHPRSVLASPARAVLSAMHARLVTLAARLCGTWCDHHPIGPVARSWKNHPMPFRCVASATVWPAQLGSRWWNV